ncbi:Uncharacterized membrane-anchored protein YitT, contains DUF161 and DUF2179 domains [Hathewaya proteolytica DSM 3090]|uniref:Uncharacterized membrane-anchored protein YitT, contains DUF161 and DUF2179 domains n=1 Tax=Hathewaya proteolytica DSM 3090 TaxID=1121331 RepID=A0A1M6Q3Y6_9CLOT|nr:YitT family protein [Hathewaya proteolytica]SHK14880.1 Uncharacterized membrane-anchored protein YitT, contains DUF161 and DUF2179 domains [Hathewaya proteolytica DSM 3090]
MGNNISINAKEIFNRDNLRSYFMMTLGLFFLAIGVHFFQSPNNLALGGVTGIAMVLCEIFPAISMGTYVFILNGILLIIGFIFIGASFGVKTIYCSLMYSVLLMALEKIYPMTHSFTQDLFIELIIGIVISAIGMAIVFNENGSTGGTDIIAKILNKFLHIQMGKSLLIADFFVTLMAFYAFGMLKGMYAIVGIMLNGIIIDEFTAGISICKKVEIFTDREKEVLDFIMVKLSRGATVYEAEGAYTNKRKKVITTVIPKKEFISLKTFLRKEDPNCFVITYDVHETLGEGFKDIKQD